jgi:hypothetical protein
MEGYERKNKEEIHKELQDQDPIGFPHLEEKVIGENIDLDLLSLFPKKYERNMGGKEEGGQAFKINNGGERSPKTWLAQGGRRGIYSRENLAVGSKSRQSSAVSLAPPDFRPDYPTVTKKLPSSAVRRAARFFWPGAGFPGLESGPAGPGAKLSAKKKHQHENGDNFCIRTPF